MAKIDPNDEKYNSAGSVLPVESCTGDFVVLGFEHFDANGKAGVEVRSVCVRADKPGQVGRELKDVFWLHTPGALTRIVRFTKEGLGNTEPFDPESPADLAKIVAKRPFRATVVASPDERDPKYTKHETAWTFTAPSIKQDPATGSYMLTAEEAKALADARKRWEGFLAWRAKNPRGAKSSGGSGGGGSSGGGADHGGSSGSTSGGGQYDDIPF